MFPSKPYNFCLKHFCLLGSVFEIFYCPSENETSCISVRDTTCSINHYTRMLLHHSYGIMIRKSVKIMRVSSVIEPFDNMWMNGKNVRDSLNISNGVNKLIPANFRHLYGIFKSLGLRRSMSEQIRRFNLYFHRTLIIPDSYTTIK